MSYRKINFNNGNIVYSDMTQQEIDEMNAAVVQNNWHDNTCENRAFITDEKSAELLFNGDGKNINSSIVNGNLMIIPGDGGRYIYFNNITPPAYTALLNNGAIFETKPIE